MYAIRKRLGTMILLPDAVHENQDKTMKPNKADWDAVIVTFPGKEMSFKTSDCVAEVPTAWLRVTPVSCALASHGSHVNAFWSSQPKQRNVGPLGQIGRCAVSIILHHTRS